MKFTASQSRLLSTLSPISTIVPAKSPMPVLSHFLAEVKGNELTLTGSDIEVTMQTEQEVRGLADGKALLPAKKFMDLIRSLPDEMITVDASKENHIVITDPEGKKYQCTAESADAFPAVPKVDRATKVIIKRDDLRRMIGKCLFAVSKDELRPQLTGVYLQVLPDKLRLVTTDGHRLVKVSAPHQGFKGEPKDAIVPAKAMQAVQRIAEGDGNVEISFAGTQLAFEVGNTRLITRLIEGRYPNYEAVIPTENKNLLKMDTDTLSAAVRRAAIFSNEVSRQIRMKVAKEQVQIQVEDVEQGNEGYEALPCEFGGEPMDIGYNAGYVLDMLRQIDTSEVQFELGTATSAGIVRPTEQKDNEELLMLIMPVRLN